MLPIVIAEIVRGYSPVCVLDGNASGVIVVTRIATYNQSAAHRVGVDAMPSALPERWAFEVWQGVSVVINIVVLDNKVGDGRSKGVDAGFVEGVPTPCIAIHRVSLDGHV